MIHYLIAESLAFAEVPIYNSSNCYYLISNVFPANIDSIYYEYNINDGEVRLVDYQLDTTQENKLEVLEFDVETN